MSREHVVSAPHSRDAEVAVLGAMLFDTPALRQGAELLSAGDFYVPEFREAFSAILAVHDKGQGLDPITLHEMLLERGKIPAAGLRDFVGFIFDSVPTAAHVQYHAGIVREKAHRRAWIDAMREAAKQLAAGEPLDTIDLTHEQRLSALRLGVKDSRVFDDKRVMAAEALRYLTEEGEPGTPYGFASWDAAVLPALTGHLILLGGASGSGKSTVARCLVRNRVQRYAKKTAVLTCEMTGEEQLVALACMDLGLPLEGYYRRTFTTDEQRAFGDALGWWRDNANLALNEMGHVTPDRVLRIFKRWREQGYTELFLDHLHRVDYGATKSGDDLRIPIAALARNLKNFAKDQEATVTALVQYTKIKPHTEPDDSNIREANNILEEADAVFHIYRPLVAHERSIQTGELVPLQQSNGLRFFEHDDAPKGAIMAADGEYVYIKLGKQRKRLRDGLVRVPFNKRSGLMYDSPRVMP